MFDCLWWCQQRLTHFLRGSHRNQRSWSWCRTREAWRRLRYWHVVAPGPGAAPVGDGDHARGCWRRRGLRRRWKLRLLRRGWCCLWWARVSVIRRRNGDPAETQVTGLTMARKRCQYSGALSICYRSSRYEASRGAACDCCVCSGSGQM